MRVDPSNPKLPLRRGSAGRSRWTGFVGLLLGVAVSSVGAAAPLSVIGDAPTNGIFDPSVEYAPGASEGWLTYSAVYGNEIPYGPHVETRIARSTDGGGSWSFVSVVNPSTPGQITLPGQGSVDGVWNTEVSSIVYDPGDPGAEWKIFGHRIFRKLDDGSGQLSVPAYSWINLRTAPDPGGPWGPDVALMSSGVFPPEPYASAVQTSINDLDPSLADLIVYSEPGTFVHAGILYLSLSGLLAGGSDRIVLLASDDHGASWRYVGTPLSSADAPALGFLSFDGSAIVAAGGRHFLTVTPETATDLHNGTLVLEFDDLATGQLVRTDGVPTVHLHVPPNPGSPANRRGGQADYHVLNTAGGLLLPSLHLEDLPEMFQVTSTGIHLVSSVPALGFSGRAALGIALVALGFRLLGGPGRRPGDGRMKLLDSLPEEPEAPARGGGFSHRQKFTG